MNYIMKKIKGGLALATVIACTIFAALCGSSPATAAAVGRVSVGAMTRRRYRKDFAVGTVAGGGTLGIMIPPSITLVAFGILTETSIAKLLIAGLLPGVLLACLMCVYVFIRSRLQPDIVGDFSSAKDLQKLEAGKIDIDAYDVDVKTLTMPMTIEMQGTRRDVIRVVPAVVLILIVLGSMYTGAATPTESAAIGVIGAFAITAALKRMKRNIFSESLRACARTSCMMIFLCVGGLCLSFVVAYLGIPDILTSAIVNMGVNKYIIIIILYVLWLVMGCLMDPGTMIVLTIPFLFITLVDLGFNAIWIGIVSTICVEIGMITPPVGMNLFILKNSTDLDLKWIIKGTLPYVGVEIAGLVLITIFPQIALFLPQHM
jgi:tripartite ATP-independent transporter DctM subunit